MALLSLRDHGTCYWRPGYLLLWGVVALGVAASLPIPAFGLLLLWLVVRLALMPDSTWPPMLATHLWPTLALVGAYASARTHVTVADLPALLGAMVAWGCFVSSWTAFSLWKGRGYEYRWHGLVLSEQDSGDSIGNSGLSAGQANRNHLEAGSVLCAAAGCGLALLVSPWWAVIVPWLLLPVLGSLWQAYRGNGYLLSQGIGASVVLGIGLLAIASPDVAVYGVGGLLLWLARYLRQAQTEWYGPDSGRFAAWRIGWLYLWWRHRWIVRLIGLGPGMWEPHYRRAVQGVSGNGKGEPMILTNAHNEYLQILVEHGLIGLTLLLAGLGTVAWRLLAVWTPETQAAWLLFSVLCALALVSHPWTWLREGAMQIPSSLVGVRPQHVIIVIGNPALHGLVFLIALCVGVNL